MKVTWYGHAAFLVEASGLRIILDPYRSPDCGGYEPIADPADLVVVSHENDRYHSHLGQIPPPFEVVEGMKLTPEGELRRGIRFQAIPVFETPQKQPGDEVSIVHFRADGLHLVFLGDLGHALSTEEIELIRGADILLVPAGGPPTIDFPLIPALIGALDPRLIVPMHYLTPKINLAIQPVERFLEVLPNWPVDRPGHASFEVAGPRRIVVLNHAR